MPVRKRAGGVYHFRFQIGHHQFSGSTGTTDKRSALMVEAERRRQAQEQIRTGSPTAALTLGCALTAFWNEVGTFYTGTYRATVWTALQWLRHASGISESTLLRDVGALAINDAVARRRAEGVSNATINRTVTEILRRIFIRARDKWEQPVKAIAWKKIMRPEPKERIRSLATHEESALMATILEDYRPAISFMLKSGFRLRETVNLRQRDIDWQRGTIAVIGKGDKAGSIPLSNELRALLAPLRAPREYVFTYVAARTRDGRCAGNAIRSPMKA